jgi:hypothetical protein
MSNDFQDLKAKWQSAKQSLPISKTSSSDLMKDIDAKRKSGLRFQYGNIAILGATLVALILVFVVFFPFKELMSRIAVALMVGGMAVRVAVEFISVQKSRSINMGATALETLQSSEAYLSFRKKVHGPVTISILMIYTVGYYAILPELSRYFDQRLIIFWAIIYVVGLIVFGNQVRKSIRKEIKELEEIVTLKKEILQKEEGETE